MKRWFGETLKTLSVTTLHPLGWSLGRLQKKIKGDAPRFKPSNLVELAAEQACPVVLIHGIFHNSTAFFRLERKLGRQGFQLVRTLELWTTIDSFDSMIEQLKLEVNRLNNVHSRQNLPGKVRLVAHSMGGMVVRAALLDPEFAKQVDKVIFLGTPHQGSFFYRLPFPRCLRSLSSDSSLMKRIQSEPLPPKIDYWNLRGGVLDVITPKNVTFLPHVKSLLFEDVGHAGLLADRHVIQSIISILETPFIKNET